MNVLYITYDGITDHIGQSQVAPYLIGLSKLGYNITLLSAEKMDKQDIITEYKKKFETAGVDWQIVTYHKKPPVFSTVWDVRVMNKQAGKIIKNKNIQFTHCRGYIASLVGLHYKKKRGIKFIFDMRDFWPDAAKEIKRFDVEHSRLHRAVYKYFKKKEKEFLEYADHIVSLTEAGKKVLQEWTQAGMKITAPVSVIPCCADFDVFDRDKLDKTKIQQQREQLGLNGKDFVLNYLGSLGPSYLTDEMMDVFKALLKKRADAKFLIVANNDHHLATEAAKRKGIDPSKIIVIRGKKEEIPYLIAQSDLSLFFIIPSFAKQACSPTKLAELLAMNVPVIANTKVGDLDVLLNIEKNSSAVVKSFDDAEYDRVLSQVLKKIEEHNTNIRQTSGYCSLKGGIESYSKVYQSLQ